MRPIRFEALLASAAATLPSAGVNRFSDIEPTRRPYPFGVGIEMGGRSTKWQIVAVSAQGDKYETAETNQAFGERPSAPQQATATAGSPEHLEAALAAAVLSADEQGEIASVQVYNGANSVGCGFTLVCHNGAKLFVNNQR